MNLPVSVFCTVTLIVSTAATILEAAGPGSLKVSSDRTPITARPLTLTIKASKELESILRQTVADRDKGLRLTIEKVRRPAKRAAVRVYLGLRPDQNVPDIESNHFVGTFSFFGDDEAEENSFFLELSSSVRKLVEAKQLSTTGDLGITLVATPIGTKGDLADVAVSFEGLRLTQTKGTKN